jgi:RecA/RadA recombinase
MRKRAYLSTGIPSLDSLLGGGIPINEITLIYGEAATGKTTLAVTIALNHLESDPASKVIYIDTDDKLNHNRLYQIADQVNSNLLHRLHIQTPQTFDQQINLIENLSPKLEPGDLTIIDSITGLYRVEAGEEVKTFSVNKELNHQLGYIKEMSNNTGTSFILTGQVRSIFEASGIEPVAPRLLSHWTHTILKLEKNLTPNRRQATIEKPIKTPNTLYFNLSDKGVEEYKI